MKLIQTAALLLALGSISTAPIAFADHHEKGAAHDCKCDKDCSDKCSKNKEGEHCTKCHDSEGKEGSCEHCKKGDCKDGACDLHKKKKKGKKAKAAAHDAARSDAKSAEKKAEEAAPAAAH